MAILNALKFTDHLSVADAVNFREHDKYLTTLGPKMEKTNFFLSIYERFWQVFEQPATIKITVHKNNSVMKCFAKTYHK